MIDHEYTRQMALYNRWQNEKLYGSCRALADAERKRDRGMFFGSIHRTLDHIAMIDRAILHMVRTGERPTLHFEAVQFDDFDALWDERQRIDRELGTFAEERDAAWLAEKAHPTLRRTRGFMIVQLFNHQTHHRSQVTSELFKLGIDYGCTDMPYNPYLDSQPLVTQAGARSP
jgi:uncharacterized damage-inducible protein DinB